MTGDVAERSLRYTKDQFEQVLEQTEEYVRENPARSVAYAVIAGFILNRLPIGRILGGFVRLLMIAFKPAILAYGATKLYQAAQRRRRVARRGSRVLFVEREADLHRHLPVIDLAVLDVPARFDDFEPAHVADGLLGAGQRVRHRFFDAVR